MDALSFRPRFVGGNGLCGVAYDAVVDGELLTYRLRPGRGGLAGLLGWGSEEEFALNKSLLLGERKSELPDGRIVLFSCAIDGDPDCDAIAAKIQVAGTTVTWSEFGDLELSFEPATRSQQEPHHAEIETLTFDRRQYECAIRELVYCPPGRRPVIRRDGRELVIVSNPVEMGRWLEAPIIAESLTGGDYEIWEVDGSLVDIEVACGDEVVLRPTDRRDDVFRRVMAPMCRRCPEDPLSFDEIEGTLRTLDVPNFTLLDLYGGKSATSKDWRRPWQPTWRWSPDGELRRMRIWHRF